MQKGVAVTTEVLCQTVRKEFQRLYDIATHDQQSNPVDYLGRIRHSYRVRSMQEADRTMMAHMEGELKLKIVVIPNQTLSSFTLAADLSLDPTTL